MKKIIYFVLKRMQFDRFFRYVNKNKVLILSYHGVTNKQYSTLPWTLLPDEIFERQIQFLNNNYNLIPLSKLIEFYQSKSDVPPRSAVITFDDGYRNNFTVALPILKKYKTPASIFLTAGYIGTTEILPLDELYLIIFNTNYDSSFRLPEINLGPLYFSTLADKQKSFEEAIVIFKKMSNIRQKKYVKIMRSELKGYDWDNPDYLWKDFMLMDWDDVHRARNSGLIEFGAHTVSHEILTNLQNNEAEEEILKSKTIIERHLQTKIDQFAFPNGGPNDYNQDHIQMLKKHDFKISVTSESVLNSAEDDYRRLGRMCIGSDYSSNQNYFKLRTSGFISDVKHILKSS